MLKLTRKASNFNGSTPYLMHSLCLIEAALELLDAQNAPGEIGADLDMARCRLRSLLKSNLALPPHCHCGANDEG